MIIIINMRLSVREHWIIFLRLSVIMRFNMDGQVLKKISGESGRADNFIYCGQA